MSSEDQKNNDKESGFSGLSSMVSDVDATIAATKHTPPTLPTSQSSNNYVNAESQSSVTEVKSKLYQQTPPKLSSYSAVEKWMIGIFGIFGLIIFLAWVTSLMDNRVTDLATYGSSQSESTTPASTLSQDGTSNRPFEEEPPIGTNLVLTRNQINYCLAEYIRLEAYKVTATNNNESDFTSFNSTVADYNNRCGEYRYSQNDLSSATYAIEQYRSVIEAEGRSRFTVASRQVSQPSPPQFVDSQYDSNLNSNENVGSPQQHDSMDQEVVNNKPDLSNLNTSERQSIEAACSSDKYMNGPAAYNTCLSRQLNLLNQQGSRPDLSNLNTSERQSIEAACSSAKYMNGPAAYNTCLSNQLSTLNQQGSRPDLSNLNTSERQSIESACSTDKYMNGPAAYNTCLTRQLSLMPN